MKNEKLRRWILSPCPVYDTEGMEQWLRKMAREGWQLSEEGFLCGFGAFDRDLPRQTDFRLSIDVRKRAPMDGEDHPDEEMTDYSRLCGWEYIAKRGDFYIWRSDDAARRELDTDPQVKAMAVDVIRKRQRSAAVRCLLWGLVYPLLKLRGGVFLSMINLGSGFVLLGLLLALWFFCAAGIRAVRLNRLRKEILNETKRPETEKENRMRHYVPVILRWTVTVLWILVGFSRLGAYITEEGEIPLQDYREDPPFATVEDFLDAEEKDYHLLNYSFSNKVRQWEDWLSPVNFEWDEIAVVSAANGKKVEGILFLEYHEVIAPWIARRIAREYWLHDRWEKGYEALEAPELDADFCVAYLDRIHTPTVIICAGNRVIRASFKSYSQEDSLTVAQWAGILAESIRG